MKSPEFKLNRALPPSLNIIRLYGFIRAHGQDYRPTSKGRAVRQRNGRDLMRGRPVSAKAFR